MGFYMRYGQLDHPLSSARIAVGRSKGAADALNACTYALCVSLATALDRDQAEKLAKLWKRRR